MKRLLVVATALLLVGCLDSPISWSPDGKWLAYTVEVRPLEEVIQPGWIYGEPTLAAISPPLNQSPPKSYRLWATRVDTGVSTLMEESKLPITAPGWSPDGRALAFGRIVAEPNGKGRFEVVILDGPNGRRVLSSRSMAEIPGDAGRLAAQAIVWSPDGRYLAVPQLAPRGLAILRSDNGRQVDTIGNGFLPSWAPDGSRLACYVRGTADTLVCLDSPLGQPRNLVEVGEASQAPVWTRDGQNVLVVTKKPFPRDFEANAAQQAEILRVRVDSGQAEALMLPLTADLGKGKNRALEGVSITLDRAGDNLFSSVVIEGQPCQVTWYRPRDGQTYARFSVLDYSLPVSSLSVAPDGRVLAVRVGPVDRLNSPALCDLDSNDPKARPIVPDDDARIVWIATTVQAARSILANLPVASTDPTHPAATRVDRPTVFPILGEFDPTSEAILRLRKLGRVGRTLCERPAEAPAPGPELAAILDEARLFFDYLREDYPAALASLEAVENRADSPERRLALLSVRAQIFLNRTELDRAGRTIAYLQELDPRPGRRIEETADGPRLTEIPESKRGWPAYLALRASVIRTLMLDGDPDRKTHLDGFRPGLRFEPAGNVINPFFPQDRPFLEVVPPPPERRKPPGSPSNPRMPPVDRTGLPKL